MNKHLRRFAVLVFLATTLAACVSPLGSGQTQPASMDQVATAAAMTLQALAPEAADTSSRPLATNLFPHSLYFLGKDSQSLTQIYRMERDGQTKIQLTFEPLNVEEYDVSLADATIAYVSGKQLLLANADGSNRRVLVDEGYDPVFSTDGQTLAYAHGGLNLYSFSTGTSNLVIQDQFSDPGTGQLLPIETYSPERYSPDGTKLLIALGHWEVAPSHAVYHPSTNTLVRYAEVQDYIYCCSFHGGPVWSPDSSSFYGVASAHDYAYKSGEVWKIDATNGAVARMLKTGDGTLHLPKELYLAPDGQLYFFLGTYNTDSGYFDAPLLELVRSAGDDLMNRTVLRRENFVLMNEALWAPDASFVIVSTALERNSDLKDGVLELYYTEGQKDVVWLAPSGWQMKWGP